MAPRPKSVVTSSSPSSMMNMGVIENSVAVSSILLWMPYALMAVFVAYCASFYYEVDTGDASPAAAVPVSSLTSSVIALLGKTRLSHSHSRFYYYIFPEGFDITTFIPLLVRVLVYSAACIFTTFAIAVHVDNSAEILMALSWLIGVLSESMWTSSAQSASAYTLLNISTTTTGAGLNSTTTVPMRPTTIPSAAGGAPATASSSFPSSLIVNAASHFFVYDSRVPHPSPWLWLVVSILTGGISGIFCKAKDVRDGKVSRDARQMLLSADQSGGMFSRTGVVSLADIDGRRRRHRRSDRLIGLTDRMYMAVPFWSGQWTSFIAKHGWRGVIVENGIIVLTLGVIGYAMLSYRVLQRQLARTGSGVVRVRRVPRSQIAPSPFRNPTEMKKPVTKAVGDDADVNTKPDARHKDADGSTRGYTAEGEEVATKIPPSSDDADPNEELVIVEEATGAVDLMELVSKLFTTSFGAVVVVVLVVNIFISSLVIPFLKTLFSLNALVSSVGIIVEIMIYEIV